MNTPTRQRLRPELRIREQFDERGDLVYELQLQALTHSRRELDRVAEQLGAELVFLTEADDSLEAWHG